MPLTNTTIQKAKPRDKAYKLYDTEGLSLIVRPNGAKWWRLKYRFSGKEKCLSLGIYPQVTLKHARERRDQERMKLANHIDPSRSRQARKAARTESHENTFKLIALEWIENKAPAWTTSTKFKTMRRFENDAFPWFGKRPIREITAPEILEALRRAEQRGAGETAHRLLNCCSGVFRYAIATGRAERNPAADLRGALRPVKGGHFAAITDPNAVGALMRAIYAYQGNLVIRSALRLAPLLFVRPGELRKAEWTEIDFEKSEWMIPAGRMKMRQAHLVPLCRQAVETLEELRPLTGQGRYLFPSPRAKDRPISDMALLAALRVMGFAKEEMTVHGFRAIARTVLDEVLHFRPDIIEHQLAHAVRDPNGRAYNRTAHLPQRRKMMQKWADYLDKLRAAGEVVHLRAA